MIFITGVHGVGKNSYCNDLKKKSGMNFYSAGDIIGVVNHRNKKVQDIDMNQKKLLHGLQLLSEEKEYILAGHCCLINKEGDIERIKMSVFQKMNISKIIILTGNPKEISLNLKQRDHVNWDDTFISRLQKEEVEYSKEIAKTLNVKYEVVVEDYKKNNIILPIKSVYVDKILSGEKKYEYRKKLCKKRINKIYLYKTAPEKAIVGEAEVLDFLVLNKEQLWEETKEKSGISKEYFDNYFKNSKMACAYALGKVVPYDKKIKLKNIGINYTIQSYVYVRDFDYHELTRNDF